jgi:UDP-N-acetylglucosamine transferase subunit ALG13
LDQLKEDGSLTEEVVAQTGHSDYKPRYYSYTCFFDKETFENYIADCDLLITHSGVGTIIAGLNHRKPVIVFPRLQKYQEHVDDHQLEIANAMSDDKNVTIVYDVECLEECLKSDFNFTEGFVDHELVSQLKKYILSLS